MFYPIGRRGVPPALRIRAAHSAVLATHASVTAAYRIIDAVPPTWRSRRGPISERATISTPSHLFAQEMIDEADRDGDGEINEEEFLRIMKKTSLY